MNAPLLRLDDLTKNYEPGRSALQGISLEVEEGEVLAVLGPSGCGKTTLLRLVAGFELPDRGSIQFGGQTVATGRRAAPAEARGIGMVFQDFALFPHLSVARNVGFGLERPTPKRIGELLELVGLESRQDSYPHELSGGQQQRVALARALAPEPRLILLDEPFSNLDVEVRAYLREEVRAVLKRTATAAIFVTHDRSEALSLGDRVAVLQDGRLEQWGRPEQVYREPQSRFVAQFVGRANFLKARRTRTGWQTELGLVALDGVPGDEADVVVYPEAVLLSDDPHGQVEVVGVTFLGKEYRYRLRLPSGTEWQAEVVSTTALKVGTHVRVELGEGKLSAFRCN
ncbi:MAG: ABC transporter ATP-binding protein [Gemmatimonadaceae bacterium]|nr:ABC transporter ATP-binding protein [Gloeobacterales cyanobacterium ES-bin-141]